MKSPGHLWSGVESGIRGRPHFCGSTTDHILMRGWSWLPYEAAGFTRSQVCKSNSTDGYVMKAPALFQTVPGTLLAISKNLSLGQIHIGGTVSDPESIFYTISTVKNDIQSVLVITMRVQGGHYTLFGT